MADQDIYRQLQERLDLYSVGFPATGSGVEIRILKKLFNEEDVALFLALPPQLETPGAVAGRLGRLEEEVAGKLEDMAQRGLLFRKAQGDSAKYGAIPFVHGLFEFQVKRMDTELAGFMEEYLEEGFKENMARGAELFLRPIPVGKSIEVTRQVAAYEDAAEILRGQKRIVITDCICRKARETVEKSCGGPLEACFMFGSMGQYYLDHDMGREIGLDEALKILADCRDAGLVTQPATAQNPAGMCNCCGDCCGVLRSLNSFPRPAEMVLSNWFAVVDRELCTGCETCLDRCQMGAISLDDDGLAEINLDRCIGCGLCVTTCPVVALKLTAKPQEEHRIPPATSLDQMLSLARKRGIQI
ncbi:MAG: 4Fe-4S binding protein [Pseudomonadota bacterium]